MTALGNNVYLTQPLFPPDIDQPAQPCSSAVVDYLRLGEENNCQRTHCDQARSEKA